MRHVGRSIAEERGYHRSPHLVRRLQEYPAEKVVAGDTISYGQLAEVVERVTGRAFEKTEWTLDKFRADLAATPDDLMAHYRTAFALDDGMWWDKSNTYNKRQGLTTVDVEGYLRAHR